MKKTMTKIATKISTVLMVMFIAIPLAFAAMTVETAKSQGLVGERLDGMLGIVAPPTAELKDMVDKINAERVEKYKRIAEKRGTSVDAVQAYAGKKLIGKASAGEYIQNAGGGWQKK